MSAVEIVVLVAAVIVSIALLGRFGGDFFGGGTVGDRSTRGRFRTKAEKASIDRDRDLTNYSPRGGHQDAPGLRKPPNEGGLL